MILAITIIGKVLLTILKILLFLFLAAIIFICLVVFVPVRYKLSGKYYENETIFRADLSWLMHIVVLKVESDGSKASYTLKVFGKKILPGKGGKKKVKKAKERKNTVGKKHKVKERPKTEEKKDEILKDASVHTENSMNDTRAEQEYEHSVEEVSDTVKKENDSSDIENNKDIKAVSLSENENKREKTADKKNIISKIFSKIKKIPDLLRRIVQGIKNFINTIKKMWTAVKNGNEKANLVKEFAFGSGSRNMVCFVRDNMLHLLKHIKPRYLVTDIRFGFDDPSVTGKVLGALAAFCAMAGFKPGLTPDFERKIFEGEINVKGRVMFFVLLKIALRAVLSEEIKSFRKEHDNLREVL